MHKPKWKKNTFPPPFNFFAGWTFLIESLYKKNIAYCLLVGWIVQGVTQRVTQLKTAGIFLIKVIPVTPQKTNMSPKKGLFQ